MRAAPSCASSRRTSIARSSTRRAATRRPRRRDSNPEWVPLSPTARRQARKVSPVTTGTCQEPQVVRTLDIARDDRAPRVARQVLEELAEDLDPSVLDNARLLVTELVSNSVRHGD